ncbi:MAG: acetate kinase [Gallionella sp.]|nr:acetate kinase [Gallionella sp.]MDD4958353.1 acetate kinase [Gallionella sp.]
MKHSSVLVINSGSSSLKAELFQPDGTRRAFRYDHIGRGGFDDHAHAFAALMHDLGEVHPALVGHRFVHGGEMVDAARLVDEVEFARLTALIPLAPLHLPSNLLGVELCRAHFPVPQIACFDTAFHATLPESAWRLPIPRETGLRRYGFHGLNYAHIARRLPDLLGDAARGRIVVAHLGSGASLCLFDNLKSIDTTMGYTPAGGIVMGTRSGDLDPGALLALVERYGYATVFDWTYHKMGLIALSDGESNEMSDLLASDTPQAQFAVQYFCQQVRAAIGAFAAKVGGIDALVFTAGIGEHAAIVREMICQPLACLGFQLDDVANQRNFTRLHRADTKPILCLPADEEEEIYRLVVSFQKHV